MCTDVCIGPRERHQGTALAMIDAWGVALARRHDEDLDEFADSAQALGAAPTTDSVPGESAQASKLQRLFSRIGAWADGEVVIEGSPTLREFRIRIGRWMRRELTGAGQGALTMGVTSGGVIAAAMCEVLDLPDSMFLPLASHVRNASLTGIAVSRGRPVIVSFNSTALAAPAGHIDLSAWTNRSSLPANPLTAGWCRPSEHPRSAGSRTRMVNCI